MQTPPILNIRVDNRHYQLHANLVAASVTTRDMMPLPLLMADLNKPGELTILITVKDEYAQLAHLMLASYLQRVRAQENITTTQLLAEAVQSLIETAADESLMDIAFGYAISDPHLTAAQAAVSDISDRIHQNRKSQATTTSPDDTP